jgi:cation:H+ antiporter
MGFSVMLLIVGLVLLIVGADRLVDSVSSLARRAGVSPLVIGMTVVAFGTSSPEIVVNLMAAVEGRTALSFGSLVGSCLLNLGIVVGFTAILKPIAIESKVVLREIPMVILAALSLLAMTSDSLDADATNGVGRTDGIMLLLLFGVFLYYTFLDIYRQRHQDDLAREMSQHNADATADAHARPIWRDVLVLVVSLAGVAGGGRLVVSSAVTVAEAWGVPPVIIGLTILSIGTTLPELTTSLLAARRGYSDLAIGNALGSCIFNILLIGGLVACVHPIELPVGGRGDLIVFTLLAIVLLPMIMFDAGQRRIGRIDGIVLAGGYIAYSTYRAISAMQ